VALTDEMPRAFPPGSEFYWGYSNTNYVILGVLIEELEGRPFHDVLRTRLFDRLGMDTTYLAGYEEGPEPVQGYFSPTFTPPAEPIDFPYTAIATSAWAAGGLVSTARDLHTLFVAAFDGSVVSAGRVVDMFEEPRPIPVALFGLTATYGLGVQVFERFAGRPLEGFVGHIGDVPGYVVVAAHHRDSGTTIVWAVTSNVIDPSPMLYPAAEAVANR
jgi:D-alanyl-D-alanine carboxypeptidase